MIRLSNMLKAAFVTTLICVATTIQPYYVAHFSQTYENNTWIVENAVYCVHEDGSRTLVSYKRSVENQLSQDVCEDICDEQSDYCVLQKLHKLAMYQHQKNCKKLSELERCSKACDWPQEMQQPGSIPTQEELTQTASTLWHNKLDPADETAMAEFDEEWLK